MDQFRNLVAVGIVAAGFGCSESIAQTNETQNASLIWETKTFTGQECQAAPALGTSHKRLAWPGLVASTVVTASQVVRWEGGTGPALYGPRELARCQVEGSSEGMLVLDGAIGADEGPCKSGIVQGDLPSRITVAVALRRE